MDVHITGEKLEGELDSIESRPLLLVGAPCSWLYALLVEWLEWPPGDNRKSTELV